MFTGTKIDVCEMNEVETTDDRSTTDKTGLLVYELTYSNNSSSQISDR